jgi:hypothetical protein
MMEVTLTVKMDGITVVAEMRYIEELHYPLMYVRSIQDE